MQPADQRPLRTVGVAGSVRSVRRAHDDEPRCEDEQWVALLKWLESEHGMDVGRNGLLVERRDVEGAGKGLFALESCVPSSTLFTIPSTAMINFRTLSKLYSFPATNAPLSATQIIALHLLLHRPAEDGTSRDPAFGPYISTMPQSFDTHPATWAIRNHMNLSSSSEKALLTSVPPTISSALEKQIGVFMTDWKTVVEYIAANIALIQRSSRHGLTPGDFHAGNSALMEDFLWAWLIVNTRCIYYQLNPVSAAPENLTLCPVLDFANHAPEETHIVPILPSTIFPPTPGSSKRGKPGLGGDYMFIASRDTPVRKDEELFLRYGGHANRTLFVEYGFVNIWDEGDCRDGKFNGETDVQDIVENLFANNGVLGQRLKEVLKDEGYWGDWTMHSRPAPAHPSYRLMSALRLLHAVPESSGFDEACELWKSMVMGQSEVISAENERAWRATLLQICSKISERAGTAVAPRTCKRELASRNWVEKNIELLWREELEVAEAVASSVRAGVEF